MAINSCDAHGGRGADVRCREFKSASIQIGGILALTRERIAIDPTFDQSVQFALSRRNRAPPRLDFQWAHKTPAKLVRRPATIVVAKQVRAVEEDYAV